MSTYETTERDQTHPAGPATAPGTQVLGDVAVPASGVAYWRAVWSLRHTVTFVVAAAVLFMLLVSARQNALAVDGLPAALDVVALTVAALLGAVTLATYIPPAGVAAREHLTGGSCGIIPLAATVLAPVMFAQAPGTLLPVVALLACYGLASTKRITDHASC